MVTFTPAPIELKFGTTDYVHHTNPQTKIETHRFRGIGWR